MSALPAGTARWSAGYHTCQPDPAVVPGTPRWTVMAESRSTAITVAVIGAVATVVAALIGVVLMRPGGDGGSPPAQPQVPGVTIAPNPAPDGGRPSVFLSRDSG